MAFSLLVVRYVTVDSIGIEAGGLLQAILSTVLAVGAVLIAMGMRYLFPLLNRPGPVVEKFAIAEEFRRRQLMILIALTVPLVLFADIVLMIMFSSKFMVASAWLPAFLVWQLLVVQSNVQMQLLFAMDDLWIVTIMQIACSLLSSVLCVVLIPSFGLSGAAAALIAGFALMIAVGAERLRRRHGYAVDGSSILLGGYAAVVLLGAPYAMQKLGWDTIPLKIAACAVLIAGLWLFLGPEEKAALKSIGRRLSVRRAAG